MSASNSACFSLCALFLSSSLIACISSIGDETLDTLSIGESISGYQTIVSKNSKFQLGLFKPDTNSGNYYIGIWYFYSWKKDVIWVANREKPLLLADNYYSSKLKLLEDGNLVILDSMNTVVWSTNLVPNPTSSSSNSTQVALLDSGNLVLRNISNSSDLIWESFDHPTHTWMPGAKIGFNKLTNASQHLTSWKSSTDPSPGFFSFELDPDGTSQLFLLRKGSVMYSTSPSSIDEFFSGSEYVSNQRENYLIYESSEFYADNRIVLDETGRVKLFVWNTLYWALPKQCQDCNLCGDFSICKEQNSGISCECFPGYRQATYDSNVITDWSSGCVRNNKLTHCQGNSTVKGQNNDGFLKIPNMTWYKSPSVSWSSGSSQACESDCLSNCSCNAYAYDGGSCYEWADLLHMGQVLDSYTSGGRDLHLKLAATDLASLTSKGNHEGSVSHAIMGSVSGVVVLLGLMVVVIWTRRRRNSVRLNKKTIHEGCLIPFSYRDLQIATKNFSEKLGRGGFGSVFKGRLSEFTVVAVKKLEGLTQGEKQFRAEVSTIGMIQHVNLVRLRGFCCQGTKRLLVYDFMPNGSLDSHLFRKNKHSEVLDWRTRYQIALGTARGLAYLHEKCRECIIHCDIKPENILLDEKFCPKVADFGLAKLLGRDFSRVLTTMRGTIGYLAPEWISGVAITAKADVYSYGMMLFELISGRRNTKQSDSEQFGFFPVWAATKINEDGELLGLLDYRLEGNVDLAELNTLCKVASWCIQDDEVHRPSMGVVVQMLEGLVEFSTPPIPRILQVLVENDHESRVFIPEPSSNKSSQASSLTSNTPSQESEEHYVT